MTVQPDDDLLLDALRSSLAPSAVRPGPAELSAFRSVLASRFDAMSATDGLAGVVPMEGAGRTGRSRSTGLRRMRHPVTALVAAAVLATSGVAAAGVATDTLPGPARRIAVALGLPVSSPALETTRGAMGDLRRALDREDTAAIRTGADAVRTDLAVLTSPDRTQVEPAADRLLARADAALGRSTGSGAHGTTGIPSGPAVPPGGGTGTGAEPGPDSGPPSGQGATGSPSGADANPEGPVGSPAPSGGAGGGPAEGPSGPSGGSTGVSGGTVGTGGSDGTGGGPGPSGDGGSDVSGGSAGPAATSGSGSAGDGPGTSTTSTTGGTGGVSPDGGHASTVTGSGSTPD
ncbi:MAG TPA: hypothetical protein VND44_12300 [Acidimicrobiales bacterium]|nr:hypothetical protein [Acidimicrobiales bacterium]